MVDSDSVDQTSPMFEALGETIPGQGVRRIGSDIVQGNSDIAYGRRVSPLDLLIARAAGLERLNVRRPRLCIVNIPASSGRAVTAQLISANAGAAGASVICTEATDRDAGACDLLVTIGGSGVGCTDATIAALAQVR